jgi:peptidoglycan/LPS O-acetylase OafA/YrhL
LNQETIVPTQAVMSREEIGAPAADRAQPRADAPASHVQFLDSVRALAALYVVVFHAMATVFINAPRTQSTHHTVLRLIADVFGSGHYAVDVFIVLSGFCLMLPVVRGDGTLRGGAILFFKRRARRILPPYYISLGFSLMMIFLCLGVKTGSEWDFSIPVTNWGIIAHVLLLQDVFPVATQINNALWSISVEWRIYFVFPILVLCWQRYGAMKTIAGTCLASLVLLLALWRTPFFHGQINNIVGVMPQYLGLFSLGMAGAAIAYSTESKLASLRRTFPWASWTILMTVLVLFQQIGAYLLMSRHRQLALGVPLQDVVVGIWTLCLLVTAAGRKLKPVSAFLEWKPLVFLGTFAYSIYLFHMPLQQFVWQFFIRPLHLQPIPTFLAQICIVTPITVGFCYLAFLVAERPFLNKRPISAARL